MKIFFSLFLGHAFLLLVFQNSAFAKTNIAESAAAYVLDSSITQQSLVYDVLEGDDEASAHLLYVPVNIASNSSDRLKNSYLSGLPIIESGLPKNPRLILYFNHDQGSGKSLYVAVRRSSSSVYQTVINSVAAENKTDTALSLPLNDVCLVGSCTLDTYTASSTEINDEQTIYVFTAATGVLSLNQTVDLNNEAFQDGAYVTIKFSSQFISEKPNLKSLQRGDGQLGLNFVKGNVSTIITNTLYKILTVNFDTRAQTESATYQDAKSMVPRPVVLLHDPRLDGTIMVTGLDNGAITNVGLAMMNKYQFVTPITPTLAGTPVEIEVFLKEQNCYLISSGFQTDHYVLDYFRELRDKILLKFSLGKQFVSWYYQWAPEYAPYIYKSSILSALVRGTAYLLYYSMIYFYPVTIFLIGLFSFYFLVIRKRKKGLLVRQSRKIF